MMKRTRFRPCIDLHEGRVKQIVGGTLRDGGGGLRTNFVAEQPAGHFARLYREDGLEGGHVIMLGGGNEAAAREALAEWPGGLQVGGGISGENAGRWLEAGASRVIVTSWLFSGEGRFLWERLEELERRVGAEHVVIDLSCRRCGEGWRVAMNRWQALTELEVNAGTLAALEGRCAEFLIHAADVEGRMAGMDEELIRGLGSWCRVPVTYAGGAAALEDLERCQSLSGGRVDLTIGSALDIFGGPLSYRACVEWNRAGGRE